VDRYDWQELGGLLLFIAAILLIAISLILGLAYTIGPRECAAKTAGLGVPHRWSFWGDCQVQIEGKWIPLDRCTWLPNGTIRIEQKP
jgi:hypothetical protein